jgi:hypothetical protein
MRGQRARTSGRREVIREVYATHDVFHKVPSKRDGCGRKPGFNELDNSRKQFPAKEKLAIDGVLMFIRCVVVIDVCP